MTSIIQQTWKPAELACVGLRSQFEKIELTGVMNILVTSDFMLKDWQYKLSETKTQVYGL